MAAAGEALHLGHRALDDFVFQDVMQQGREPGLARTSGRLVHTHEVRLQESPAPVWPFACPVVIRAPQRRA